jgi:methylglutaconyl-CoA hydratase
MTELSSSEGGKPTIGFSMSATGVATIWLQRPDRGNALDRPSLALLAAHLERVSAYPQARLLVLRGAGRHFCTGADMDGSQGEGPDMPTVLRALSAVPLPVISVVQGGCVGGGFCFAGCSDVVIAHRDAFFALSEVRAGFAPAALLPFAMRAIGSRALRRYALSGERMDAPTALRLSLVSEIFNDMDGADAALDPIVDAFLHAAPRAARATKQALSAMELVPEGAGPSLAEMVRSEEAIEGIASLTERRKPSWYVTER